MKFAFVAQVKTSAYDIRSGTKEVKPHNTRFFLIEKKETTAVLKNQRYRFHAHDIFKHLDQ